MFKIELGAKVRDRVTGFSGVVTGRADYMTGCRQYCVTAKARGGKPGESCWFDEDRLHSGKPTNPGGPQSNEAPAK